MLCSSCGNFPLASNMPRDLQLADDGVERSVDATGEEAERRNDAKRDHGKNHASLRWRKKHSAWLTLILTVLIMIGVMTVLLLRATTLPGVSAAVNATVEEISFSSKSSSSQELPRTGGP